MNNNRYLALDVLRGMTVCLMIIVNTPGNDATTFSPLLHAKWHGFTLTDLVFPTFMFVVGNAMSFSFKDYAVQGENLFLRKIFKRFILIFLLGFLMYWFPFFHFESNKIVFNALSNTRIFGVLQRIALGYLFASLIVQYWKINGAIIFSGVALLGYWGLLFAWGDYSLQGNAVLKFDVALWGERHLYHGEGIAFDPEGFLSTWPAIVNVIAGYIVGRFILQKGNTYETIAKLMMAGAMLLLIALSWNMVFPINKKLWTSSFVCYTVGLDLLILPILIFIIDIQKKKNQVYFFEVFGKNTLFIYLLSEIGIISIEMIHIGDRDLYHWLYIHVFSLAGDYAGSLLAALSWMMICWCVGWWMDRKKIYVKV